MKIFIFSRILSFQIYFLTRCYYWVAACFALIDVSDRPLKFILDPAVNDEIITDLVTQCRSNQQKLLQFVSSTG